MPEQTKSPKDICPYCRKKCQPEDRYMKLAYFCHHCYNLIEVHAESGLVIYVRQWLDADGRLEFERNKTGNANRS